MLDYRSLLNPPTYVRHCIIISFGGLLFGLDTGCIGPITTMAQFDAFFGQLSSIVHGLVVSSILIPAAITSFFAGPLADALGRPRGISIGGAFFCLGCALEAGSINLAMLFCGRIIEGIGEGLFLSTIVVYVCEIAPPRTRGVLASVQQFITTVGICSGYFICYGTVRAVGSSVSWRLPFAIMSFLALIYTLASLFLLPDSPRWLESKGRFAEAVTVWESLDVPDLERETSVEAATSTIVENGDATEKNAQLENENLSRASSDISKVSATPSLSRNMLRIFRKDVRTQTLLAVFMSGFQQLSGIDGVLYYSPLLFQQAGLSSSTASFLAGGVSALLMALVTLPAFLLADCWGRRTSTISGGLMLAGCMIILGSLYASDSVHTSTGIGRWVAIVMIYIFAIIYSITWGVTIRVHTSEIQPLATRAPATSLAQSSNWVMNWVVAFCTPIFLSRSSFGIYFWFGGCTLLATAVCAIAMPETKRRSLEEIDHFFDDENKLSSVLKRRLSQVVMRKQQE